MADSVPPLPPVSPPTPSAPPANTPQTNTPPTGTPPANTPAATTPPPSAPPVTTPPPPPVAEVPAPPPALVQLPAGTRLEATVTAQVAPDTFQVTTPVATFTLQTALPLTDGARLLLLLPERPATGFPLQILSVDGRSAAALLPAATQASAPATTPAAIAATLPAALMAGTTLSATILFGPQAGRGAANPFAPPLVASASPAPGSVAATTGNVLLPGAALGNVTVAPASLAGVLPLAGRTDAASPLLPGSGLGEVTTTASGANAQASTQVVARAVQDYARQATLSGPEGERTILRVVNLRPPPVAGAVPAPSATIPPSSAPLTPGTTIQGIVTGHLSQGFPVVQTPAGLLALMTLATVEPGTEVTLNIVGPATAGPAQGAQASLPVDGEVAALRDWPALRETLAALQATAPATAHAISSVLPRFDGTLTASVLFLLATLRGGNLRDWMGEANVRDVQRLRPDLVARVSEDFGRLGVAADDPGADWRGYLLPFHAGQTIHPVRLFIHRNRDDDNERELGTRFVVDVALSRLGRFQIDGLVNERARRFDLILRTATPLPGEMQNDIRGLFDAALGATGQTGGIIFRADPTDFVEPQPGGPSAPDVMA